MDTNHHSLVIVADTRISGACVVRARVCVGEYVRVYLFIGVCVHVFKRHRQVERERGEVERDRGGRETGRDRVVGGEEDGESDS